MPRRRNLSRVPPDNVGCGGYLAGFCCGFSGRGSYGGIGFFGSGAGSAGIRPMKGKVTWVKASNPAELDQLVDWAADEGWNPGLHDAALF